MSQDEFDTYKGSVQLKTNGRNVHIINSKLAGIQSLVNEGLSEIPTMSEQISKEMVIINYLLSGGSLKVTSKQKEFVGY